MVRWFGLWVCLATVAAVTSPAMAQGVPSLSCKDALEVIAAPTPDAFNLAAVGRSVRDAFVNQDALRVGNGDQAVAADWSADAMTGEVMAVLLSCRQHAGDMLDQRATATYRAYVSRHAQ